MNSFTTFINTINIIKTLWLLFVFIVIPYTIFSQTEFKKEPSERQINFRKAANYYLRKKISPSAKFTVHYTSLFSDLHGYTKGDRLSATKLINRLYQVNDILFYRLMRIRLEWEFKQHLVKSSLDSVRHLLKNNIDTSKYYYMLGLYFKDSMNEKLARTFGYVKATYKGDEIVDWRKMKAIKWRNPKIIETVHHHDNINFKIEHIEDSSMYYYKMAVDNNPTEFHYLKEFLLFMSNLPENKDVEIQQIINSKLDNYTDKEKKWLTKYLDYIINNNK